MKPSKPDWYEELKKPPLRQNRFGMDHIRAVERKTRELREMREAGVGKMKRNRTIYGITALGIVLCVSVIVWMQPPFVQSIGRAVSGWLQNSEVEPVMPEEQPSQEEKPPVSSPEDDEQNPSEDEQEEFIRLRTSTYAFVEEPDYYWDYGSGEVFMVSEDESYEVLEEGESFTRIRDVRDGDRTGWVNSWYIEDDEDLQEVIEVEPYEMIVSEPVTVQAYPNQEGSDGGLLLEFGKVVQVHKEYRNWAAVEIMTYDGPMTGEKWLPMDALIPFDENFAMEGHLKVDWDGSYLYDESGRPSALIDSTTQVMVEGERDGMYAVYTPGGRGGLVRKEDFVPNPFAEYQVTHMGLEPEAKLAFEAFQASYDDEELRGMSPTDVYKMHYHAVMMEDAELIYALYNHEEGVEIPDWDIYFAEWNNADEATKQRTIDQAVAMKDIEVEEVILEEEDMAIIRPKPADKESWIFRLTRNQEGIWKVSWLPRQ